MDKLLKINDIKWEKYTIESLDFILIESEKLIEETFKSFRELTNRCYTFLAVYIATFSYCINEILNGPHTNNISFIITIVGTSFCIYKLLETLLPVKMTYQGTQPEKLLIKHFEDTPLIHQIVEYKIYTIVASNNGFIKNRVQIDNRTKAFKLSAITFIITLIIALFSFYLSGRP